MLVSCDCNTYIILYQYSDSSISLIKSNQIQSINSCRLSKVTGKETTKGSAWAQVSSLPCDDGTHRANERRHASVPRASDLWSLDIRKTCNAYMMMIHDDSWCLMMIAEDWWWLWMTGEYCGIDWLDNDCRGSWKIHLNWSDDPFSSGFAWEMHA